MAEQLARCQQIDHTELELDVHTTLSGGRGRGGGGVDINMEASEASVHVQSVYMHQARVLLKFVGR